MTKRGSSRPPRELNRKQISRREKERRTNRMLILGTAGVLALVVLILGWGLYDQYVLRPRKPVATVSGVPIRLSTYQKMVTYRRWDYRNYLNQLQNQRAQLASGDDQQNFLVQYLDQQIQQIQSQIVSLPTLVLDELIDDQLIRQEAERRGLSVSDEEIEINMEEQVGYLRNPPTPEPTPITATAAITVTPQPTATVMTFDEYTQRSSEWLQIVHKAGGLSEAEFRRLVESSLYRERVQQALGDELPSSIEQIQARHILLDSQEEADVALARLNAGESFEDLATELSKDTSNKDTGGDLGWFPRGQMVDEFDAAAFMLQPGETSGVIKTEFGYHIIRVEDREIDREIEQQTLDQIRQQAFQEWLDARRGSPDVARSWDGSMIPLDKAAL